MSGWAWVLRSVLAAGEPPIERGPKAQLSPLSPTLSRMAEETSAGVDRVRLEALRYAVNDEAVQYIAIMRLFTVGLSGLLSDQSAAEVARRLADAGVEVDEDTVEARLSYLVEHGNLARSPRETEARSLSDYLRNRARYQLSQRGELVHRHVEELLGHSEAAREVSSEMLGGILAGLEVLARHDERTISAADPDTLAREIGTIFAQFDRLVHSTREFYAYLTQVLTRYDLDRGEFQAFKTALIDYLQRFVDEVQRHMPQIADRLADVQPLRAPAVRARQQRTAARRSRGARGAARTRPRPRRLAEPARLVQWRRRALQRRRRRAAARDRGDAGPAHQPPAHRLQRFGRARPLRRPRPPGRLVRPCG